LNKEFQQVEPLIFTMKILFAIKGLNETKGGAERVICQISSELANRGHDVSLLSFDKKGGRSFYELSPRVKRIELGLGSTTERMTIKEFVCRIYRLRKTVHEAKPDIVIPFMYSMYVPMVFALLGTGIPVLGSEHNTAENYRKDKLKFLLLCAGVLLMRRCTVLSEKVRQTFPSIIRHKMAPVANPVVIVKSDQKSERRKIILNVGSLTAQKDQAILITAFSLLAEKYSDWSLRIIGEGALKEALQKQIANAGLAQRIVLPGATRHIDKEYKQASVFAMSSRYESFGLVTAEAMAHGLPVVGFSDCSGTNELIESGVNGLLVSGENRAQALADGLEKLITDASLCEKFSVRGRESVKRFDTEKITDSWEKEISACAVV